VGCRPPGHLFVKRPPAVQRSPAQERVVSPLPAALFSAFGAIAATALLAGDIKRLALALGAIATAILSTRLFELSWLARLEERYATSAHLARRLRRGARCRRVIRRSVPHVAVVTRVTAGLLATVVALLVGAGVGGLSLPLHDPPWWLVAARVATHTLSYIAVLAAGFVWVARSCIRSGDNAAASPHCASPVVSSADLASRFAREDALTVAGALWLLSFAVVALA
jgi:hypothetical protein